MEEALSSSSGPLLASLSAFWLRLSENASSLGKGDPVSTRALPQGAARAQPLRGPERHHSSTSRLCQQRLGPKPPLQTVPRAWKKRMSGFHIPLRCSCHVNESRYSDSACNRSVICEGPWDLPAGQVALNNARSTYTAGKANIKPRSCHFERSMTDGAQAH